MVPCLGVVASCPGARGWSALHVQSFIPSSASLGESEFLIVRAAALSEPHVVSVRPWEGRAGQGRALGTGQEWGNWELGQAVG